jgi:hypothetical protein
MTDETKILLTAVVTSAVTSFFTVGVIEPFKAWLQRRRVRRWLYRELIHNCLALTAWVQSAKRYPNIQEHTAAQFASEYKRLAYDLAVKDAAFYALPHEEPYRIDKMYRDFELIANGAYEDAQDCFFRAQAAAASMYLAVKDRSLSKRVAFSVSTRHQNRYFRENLPRVPYVNFDDPPKLKERLHRRYDAFEYWLWRKFKPLF